MRAVGVTLCAALSLSLSLGLCFFLFCVEDDRLEIDGPHSAPRKKREWNAGEATLAKFMSPALVCQILPVSPSTIFRMARKLRELQQNVIQREHIRRLRAPSGQPQKTGGGGRVEDG